MLDAQIAGGKGLTDADKAMYTAATSQPGALTGALNYCRAMAHPSQATAPEKIKVRVPTLVIWGELDPYLLTGNLNDLQSVAPNVTIKRVPGGTHWLTHEQPEMIAREIRAFL